MIAHFTDSTQTVVMEIFGGDALIEGIDNQAQITASDPRYKAWYENLLPGTPGIEPPTA